MSARHSATMGVTAKSSTGVTRCTCKRARNPRRWSHHTRNWSRIDVITLNPERSGVALSAVGDANKQQRAA